MGNNIGGCSVIWGWVKEFELRVVIIYLGILVWNIIRDCNVIRIDKWIWLGVRVVIGGLLVISIRFWIGVERLGRRKRSVRRFGVEF